MDDEDPKVQEEAVSAMGNLMEQRPSSGDQEAASSKIMDRLRSGEPHVQEAALFALEFRLIHPDPRIRKRTVQRMLPTLKGMNSEGQRTAVQLILNGVWGIPAHLIPDFKKSLTDLFLGLNGAVRCDFAGTVGTRLEDPDKLQEAEVARWILLNVVLPHYPSPLRRPSIEV